MPASKSTSPKPDVWKPIPGTRFFTRNGEGLYERLTDTSYVSVEDEDDLQNELDRVMRELDSKLDEAHSRADRLLARYAA
jgi:hypothetical protein